MRIGERMRDEENDDEESVYGEQESQRRLQAYETQCRIRAWEVGVPALAVLACIVCLYTCEDCLLGVMLFCAVLCCKDWILVLVFVTSLVLYLAKHPMQPNTMHHISNAAFEFVQSE